MQIFFCKDITNLRSSSTDVAQAAQALLARLLPAYMEERRGLRGL
jgi:hypothetical protein